MLRGRGKRGGRDGSVMQILGLREGKWCLMRNVLGETETAGDCGGVEWIARDLPEQLT